MAYEEGKGEKYFSFRDVKYDQLRVDESFLQWQQPLLISSFSSRNLVFTSPD
jgi:hypothetical protein